MKPSLDWVVGFIEGEGSFYDNNYCPTLSISQRDKELLLLVQENSGRGVHTGKENCSKLFELIYPRLLSTYRKGQVLENWHFLNAFKQATA